MVINMDLKQLYDSIDNPLTDDTINQLIDIYAENRGNVYSGITHYHSKDIPPRNNSLTSTKERDKFYANSFNMWKRNILSMSRAEFDSLLASGLYGKDFIKLRNYLKKLPDIHSYDEMNKLFYMDGAPEDIQDLLLKYNWMARQLCNIGWTHYKSKYLSPLITKNPKVEHRLYINTDYASLYKIMNLFTEKCLQRQIPFYYKFIPDGGSRDDTIPIYSDTEHLLDYIEILKEIKKENPDINFYEPPILSGKIDGFIGYGSEPDEEILGRRESFNNVRADLIQDTIDYYREDWINSHLDTNFGTEQNPKSLAHIITVRAVNDYVEKLIYNYNVRMRVVEDRRKDGFGDMTKTVEQIVFEEKHYTPQMVNSVGFKSGFYHTIYKSVETYLHTKGEFSIDIDINGTKYKFSKTDMDNTLCRFTSVINRKDPSFREKVKDSIKKNCRQYGIMPDKFCFDYTRVASMKIVNRFRKEAVNKKKTVEFKPITPLTDEEIEEARRKVGTYVEPKPIYTKEDMMRIIFGDDSGIDIKNTKKY